MTAFGRGYRTPETALTEVFRLHPDGRHLTVTYTNDPKVYVKPHAYQIPLSACLATDTYWKTGAMQVFRTLKWFNRLCHRSN